MLLTAPVHQVPAKPIYLIHGGEVWQSNDVIEKINQNYNSFNNLKKYYFTSFSQFEQFRDTNSVELFNLDLFCEQKVNKLLSIYIGNGKFTKQQQMSLINLIDSLENSNFIIILIADRLDKTICNTNWFTTINKIGIIVTTKLLSKSSMQKWAIEQFKRLNLKISGQALSKFVDLYQNNLLDAFQSVYKLSVAFLEQSNEIDLKTLLYFIDDEAKFSLFDLQNALANKNIEQIIYILNKLKNSEQEEILILWVIIREIRNILANTIDNNIKLKFSELLQKATEIDLAIKNVDNYYKNNNQYIWGLIMDLCMEFGE